MKQYMHYKKKYWRQKANINWFTKGNKNTSVFHNLVNGKKKKLNVNRIQKKAYGEWVEGTYLVANRVVVFFQNQFSRDIDIPEMCLI